MAKKERKRVIRPATAEERERHAKIRRQVMQGFPPTERAEPTASPPGIPAQIRAAREVRGLTWSVPAKLAGISNPSTVRHIEACRDAQLSNVQAVAKVLGLRLELVKKKEMCQMFGA